MKENDRDKESSVRVTPWVALWAVWAAVVFVLYFLQFVPE